jgi:hypothetical protein
MDTMSMFDRICSSNIVIASQQRNEPDFTREQKHDILHHLYSTNPANFIYRFGSLLTDDELKQHFDSNADYIRRIASSNRLKIRTNRRYTYMQQLLANGTYFSDEAMKERSPLLYEQMIGRYDDNTSTQLVTRTANGPLADFYMEHLESINHRERLEEEFENEEQLRNDGDSESDDEDDENKYSSAEKDLYRQEFLAIQKGKDICLSIIPITLEHLRRYKISLSVIALQSISFLRSKSDEQSMQKFCVR